MISWASYKGDYTCNHPANITLGRWGKPIGWWASVRSYSIEDNEDIRTWLHIASSPLRTPGSCGNLLLHSTGLKPISMSRCSLESCVCYMRDAERPVTFVEMKHVQIVSERKCVEIARLSVTLFWLQELFFFFFLDIQFLLIYLLLMNDSCIV